MLYVFHYLWSIKWNSIVKIYAYILFLKPSLNTRCKFLKNISSSLVDKCSKSFINCLSMTSFEHNKMCGILPHIFADLHTSSWNCFQIIYNSLWQPDDLSFMFRREATVAWDWWLIRRLMPGRQYLSGLHWSTLYLTNPFGWSGRKSLWTFYRITQSICFFCSNGFTTPNNCSQLLVVFAAI